MIPVTRSFLPPIEEYTNQVQRAYDNGWLTNRGELVLELEQKLTDYLSLQSSAITCMNNGTIPLQIALKLLGKGGEVITTPFSYVATTSSIIWEGCTPVFVGIDPDHWTIDETRIEAAITEKTTCILATHVFGNPCNVDAIEALAKKHGLSVIYDAAHCFGVTYNGKSIFEYGDISTCSFHATKLFHTGEGGASFCSNPELQHKIFYSHNFGHNGPLDFHGLGINGKMSELQAAMGLAVMPHLPHIMEQRKAVASAYQSLLQGSNIKTMHVRANTEWNYSYYPVVFNTEKELLRVLAVLNAEQIFPRRYFNPSLNSLPYVNHQTVATSDSISSRVACLPIYPGLPMNVIENLTSIMLKTL